MAPNIQTIRALIRKWYRLFETCTFLQGPPVYTAIVIAPATLYTDIRLILLRAMEGNGMDEKETGRLEAFSDGVFAVAITLLVLNIKVPGLDVPSDKLPGDGDLWRELLKEWPMLVAYVTSFATIGVMWLNHHKLFKHIKRVDNLLILINLLLLLIIVFIPVPTALLAEYFVHPEAHAAAVLFSGTFFLMASCFNILWRYAAYHNRLLGKNVDSQSVTAISRQYLFGPLLYLIVFGLAWINTLVCIILSFILALFFALPDRPVRSIVQEEK